MTKKPSFEEKYNYEIGLGPFCGDCLWSYISYGHLRCHHGRRARSKNVRLLGSCDLFENELDESRHWDSSD